MLACMQTCMHRMSTHIKSNTLVKITELRVASDLDSFNLQFCSQDIF